MFARRIIISAAIVAMICPLAARASENTTAVWSDGHTSSLTDEELLKYATAMPGPAFPEEAQRAKIVGSGLYELRINKSGKVTEVAVVKSSGSPVLDQAARTAFKNWRFKAAVFARIRLPVTWAVNRLH